MANSMAIRNILWPFYNLLAILVYFPPFWCINQEKSGNTGLDGLHPDLSLVLISGRCAPKNVFITFEHLSFWGRKKFRF
jgi:hypothetical protein